MEPVRTCVGCRCRDRKTELIRIAGSGGEVLVDRDQTAPGRGAYLHPRRTCWEQAVKRRAVGRAVRVPSADHQALLGELEAVIGPVGAGDDTR